MRYSPLGLTVASDPWEHPSSLSWSSNFVHCPFQRVPVRLSSSQGLPSASSCIVADITWFYKLSLICSYIIMGVFQHYVLLKIFSMILQFCSVYFNGIILVDSKMMLPLPLYLQNSSILKHKKDLIILLSLWLLSIT